MPDDAPQRPVLLDYTTFEKLRHAAALELRSIEAELYAILDGYKLPEPPQN